MADTILLITRDAHTAEIATDACGKIAAGLTCVADLADAEDALAAGLPDLVMCDHAVFSDLRERHPRVCALLYSGTADSEQAIEAIKQGAIDLLVQPITPESLAAQLRTALRISRDIRVPAVYEDPKENVAVERIIGQSPAMKEVYKLIGLIAPRDVNVLITGESGTGKELIARAILHHSRRKDRAFLALNCAAIPETLLESELFGHEKGAFTGAAARRIGKFEQCDGGTLFLDEVGDIPLATQAKMLRVLADNSFQRLGGTQTITCDVRIIAATHQPLETLIDRGRFRHDLYYRLNVAHIEVPPLREREVDVVLLAHQLVRRYNRVLGTSIRTFAPDTLPILLKYPWPGNVRELENAIKAALVVARGTVLRPEFLPDHVRRAAESATGRAAPSGDRQTDSPLAAARSAVSNLLAQPALAGTLFRTATGLIEREMIRACLEQTRGRIAPAAKLLGISRTTLRRKMADHGIHTTTSIEMHD